METLQRIYGISFPDPKMLKEWEKFQDEAKNRDHRKLGRVWAEMWKAVVSKMVYDHSNFRIVSDRFYSYKRRLFMGCLYLSV